MYRLNENSLELIALADRYENEGALVFWKLDFASPSLIFHFYRKPYCLSGYRFSSLGFRRNQLSTICCSMPRNARGKFLPKCILMSGCRPNNAAILPPLGPDNCNEDAETAERTSTPQSTQVGLTTLSGSLFRAKKSRKGNDRWQFR